ncbi:peptidase S8/S53 domain-containing protein [Chytridium lagenaria]|nr:peptidase S8/S53 domain-containing protein [Chytridium lagenaria]
MRERVTLWICRVPLRTLSRGVSVVSCSWGGGSDTQALRDSFALLKSRNIVMFSSAGNDGRNTDDGTPEVPKRYPGVISVGASTSTDGRASFSNYGATTVQFFAPGDKVLSTSKDGLLTEGSGTSYSNPVMVSSFSYVLGLIRTLRPDLDPVAQQNAALDSLCSTAVKVSGLASVCGRIQLDEAVKKVLGA